MIPAHPSRPLRAGNLPDTLPFGSAPAARVGASYRKPRLLDLFCGGGGAGMGYHRAGFEVTGVDINPQGNYPFAFIQADYLSLEPAFLASFDAIHASPPCQSYTRKSADWGRKRTHWIEHPDLVAETREMLEASGVPYVIENVVGAPIRTDLLLCGSMFGLRIIKHRCFELSFPMATLLPACDHSDVYNPWQGKGRSADKLREAQGIDWLPISGGASRKNGYTGDLFNAIPPAYTEFVGRHLLDHLRARSASVLGAQLFDDGGRHLANRDGFPASVDPFHTQGVAE